MASTRASMPPSLNSASTTAMTSGSSARKRNGGSTRLSGVTPSSSGQPSIISPASEATARISGRARAGDGADRRGPGGVDTIRAPRRHDLVDAQPRRAEHLGDLGRERRRIGHAPGAPGRTRRPRRRRARPPRRRRARRTRRRGWRRAPRARRPRGRAGCGRARLRGVVEPTRRLVEEHDAGARGQHERQGEGQPLALGEVARVPVAGDAGDERGRGVAGSPVRPGARTPRRRSRGRAGRRRSGAPGRPARAGRPASSVGRVGAADVDRARATRTACPAAPRAARTCRRRCAPSGR